MESLYLIMSNVVDNCWLSASKMYSAEPKRTSWSSIAPKLWLGAGQTAGTSSLEIM